MHRMGCDFHARFQQIAMVDSVGEGWELASEKQSVRTESDAASPEGSWDLES